MTIQEALLDYFDKFPKIERNKKTDYVSLEWLDKDIIFSITTNPDAMGGVIRRDVVGNEIKGHSFMFSAFFSYSKSTTKMLENSSFFEELMYWVAKNNKSGTVPIFDDGRKSLQIELLQTPYLFMVDPTDTMAQYAVTFRLIYKEKEL